MTGTRARNSKYVSANMIAEHKHLRLLYVVIQRTGQIGLVVFFRYRELEQVMFTIILAIAPTVLVSGKVELYNVQC